MQTVTFDGDSVFVPNYHWNRNSAECFLPESTSILGREIRVSGDGLFQFKNDEVTKFLFRQMLRSFPFSVGISLRLSPTLQTQKYYQ
ncbi:MAG: hypothetical protein ACI9CP_000576 [Cryomorphaceae bacterium]|jgi:hypothetical protein